MVCILTNKNLEKPPGIAIEKLLSLEYQNGEVIINKILRLKPNEIKEIIYER